jgi:hypothetical protein
MNPLISGRTVARAAVVAVLLTILTLPLPGQTMTLRYLVRRAVDVGP